MTDAWYEILEESAAGAEETTARVRATDLTTGPWERGLQHAGPPAAMLARAVRRLGGAPEAALPARLSFDINAPVPTGDLSLRAKIARRGQRVALAEAWLATPDQPERPLMTLRAWLLRQRTEPLEARFTTASAPPPPDGPAFPRPAAWVPGYVDTIEWRQSAGSITEPGPATVWLRQLVRLVADEEPGGIERLVAVADSASGISGIASMRDLLYVNTDLTLHITREPRAADLWMRAQTFVDPIGVGRTLSELGDSAGSAAQGAQCLFVEPQRTQVV